MRPSTRCGRGLVNSDAPARPFAWDIRETAGTSVRGPVAVRRSFNVTAGTAYTIKFRACQGGGAGPAETASLTGVMVIEYVKR